MHLLVTFLSTLSTMFMFFGLKKFSADIFFSADVNQVGCKSFYELTPIYIFTIYLVLKLKKNGDEIENWEDYRKTEIWKCWSNSIRFFAWRTAERGFWLILDQNILNNIFVFE